MTWQRRVMDISLFQIIFFQGKLIIDVTEIYHIKKKQSNSFLLHWMEGPVAEDSLSVVFKAHWELLDQNSWRLGTAPLTGACGTIHSV